MGYQEALTILEKIVARPIFGPALRKLKTGTEIRILVDRQNEFALFHDGTSARIEERAARAPDVEYAISLEALRVLELHPGDNMAQFGIAVLEQVLAGGVQIRVCGSVMAVISGGYLNIIIAAGPDFYAYLSQHGVQNIGKITALFTSLRR